MTNLKNIIFLFLLLCVPFLLCAQQDKVSDLIQLAHKEQVAGSSAGKVLALWLQVYDELQEDKQNAQYANTCIAIANIYHKEELYKQALPYYLEALEVIEKESPPADDLQEVHQNLALTYTQLSKPDSAAYYYNIILNEKKRTHNINGQINTLQEMAKAYELNALYQDALKCNLKIDKLFETHQRPASERLLIFNNLGYTYNLLGQYAESIKYFEAALDVVDQDDLASIAVLKTNIGVANYNIGNFSASIDYLAQVRKYKKEYLPVEIDEVDQLLATVYFKKKDLHNALIYSDQAKDKALSEKHYSLLTEVYYTSALIHSELYEYDIALENFQKHLQLRDSFALEEKIRQQELLQQQINLERIEKQVKLFMINEDVKELAIAQLKVEAENQQLAFKNKEAQLLTEQKEKEILRKENELKASELKTKAAEAQQALQELELARKNLKVSQQEKEYAALEQKEKLQQLEIKNKETQLSAEQNEKNLLLRDKEISALEIQKQKEREKFFFGVSGLLSIILLTIGGFLWYFRKLNRQLKQNNDAIEQQKEKINLEKKKADDLLLNILPAQVADELKNTGKATTRKYNNVTILFTDFKDFTVLVSSIPAATLVKELNDVFSYFDDVMEEFEIEKIETIGDAYMAACGLPKQNSNHAIKCVLAARKMLDFLRERNKRSVIQWNMRVGIHSGPVVAGVVGKKKFGYDLFGDTVNTASRLESNGEVGKINISESTYQLVKDAPEISFEDRGEIEAKGKGKLAMWFVE